MNFPSITTFATSQTFWYDLYVVMSHFCFHLFLDILLFLLWCPQWPTGCSAACSLTSTILWFFHFSSYKWFLVLYHYGWKNAWYVFDLLELTERCFVTYCNLSWIMFRVDLRRTCILLLLDDMFSKYLYILYIDIYICIYVYIYIYDW